MRSRHACCHWPSAKNLQRSQCCDCNPVARICCWVRDNRHRPGARNLPRSPSRLSPMVEPLWWYTNVPRCRHVVNGGSNCDMHTPCMTLQYKVLYTSCGLGPHVKPQQEGCSRLPSLYGMVRLKWFPCQAGLQQHHRWGKLIYRQDRGQGATLGCLAARRRLQPRCRSGCSE